MERLNSNEQDIPLRPELRLDLSGGDALPFNLVTAAMQQVEGDELARLNQSVWLVTQAGSGGTYDDLLRIVNLHVDLIDTSGTFPLYGRESKIMAAATSLNEAIGKLPDSVISHLEDVLPEIGTPGIDASDYLRLIDDEIERVETEGGDAPEKQWRELNAYARQLRQCAASLRRYGV